MAVNRKLGRTSDQRRAMLRAMTTYLLENGQIKTTYARAKEVAPIAEKMIGLAKKNNLAAYRQALAYLTKEDVCKKLFDQIGPKYADRSGGYTRVLKMGPRRGDAAEMALVTPFGVPANRGPRKTHEKAHPSGWAFSAGWGRPDGPPPKKAKFYFTREKPGVFPARAGFSATG